MQGWIPWTIFGVIVVGMMALDLGVFHRQAHVVSIREAIAWTIAWLLIALGFGFAGVLVGDPPFTHYPGPGEDVVKIGTLEILTAVGFDVGLFLLVTGTLVTLVHHLAHLAQEPSG